MILRAALLLSSAILASPALAAETAPAPAAADQAGQTGQDAGTVFEAGPIMETQGDPIFVEGNVLQSSAVHSVKTPTPIIDIPQSLTITTEEEILERGFTSIGQIIAYTPGVNTSQGEGHRDAVVFRGVRSTADFFIDGMRDDVQYYRGLYNLEQVEVLRGPNALLFGRGGTGGILNRVTKKGVIGDTFAGGQVAIDTFGAYSIQGDINIAAGDNAALRVNATYQDLDNHRDFHAGERIGFNPTARLALGDATTLDLSYEYADHQRFIDRGIPTGSDGRPVEGFADITFGDPELNETLLEAHLLRATLQHNFSDSWKGVVSAFYGDYDKSYANFYVSGYDEAASPDVVTLDGYIDTTRRENLILSGNLVGELATGSLEHTLLIGGEFIRTRSDQDRVNPVWDQTGDDNEIFTVQRPLALRGGTGTNASGQATTAFFTDLNDSTQVDIDVASLYVQDEIAVTDWLNLVVGGRYDRFDIEVFNVPASELRSRVDERFSPRGGVIVKPQENLSIYASYSESFLPRSGEQYANINGSANALDPDEFTNLEAGVKWNFADAMSFTAAIFEIEQSSPQPNDNDPATLDVIDSTISGFELQLRGEVMPGWTVNAGYSWLDGEQVDRFGPTGLRPRELPENMFSIWNSVEVTDRIGVGLGLTHQDDSFIDNGNNAVLPAYTRIDAAAWMDVSDNLRVQVNFENVTDTLYFPDSHATHQTSVGAPVNARVAVTGRF
ncbi:TonB-dependent receptor [Qipengyuania nanhaisediminis]|uniref:TonB-dependent receptor n=1 Tax=Qipengyuania nanhaisediminis TaxID=604088 RepID=UPI0038B41426